MPTGVKRSLDCLAASKNDAAVDTLLSAIDNAPESIRTAALQALLDRKCKAGLRGVIARWDKLNDGQREWLSQNSSRLTQELTTLIAAGDESHLPAAIKTAIGTRDYDLFEPLLNAIEAGGHHSLGEALLQLTDCLFEEVSHQRDYRQRRDPQQVRVYALTTLEASVARYGAHRRIEPLEALLILASRENATVRSALQTGRGELGRAFVQILSTSKRPGAIRLALSLLEEGHPPLELVRGIASRNDQLFLASLLEHVAKGDGTSLAASFRKVDSLAWASEPVLEIQLSKWNEAQQRAALRLIMMSNIGPRPKLAAMVCVLQRGEQAARVEAMRSLAEFQGSSANELVLAMIDDHDPEVQAAALVQLRPRKIPGAIATLIKRLESKHAVVSQAVRECLQEFTFERFLTAFDGMAHDIRRSTGALVRKVDPRAIPLLITEMRSPTRACRIRAIEIAPMLGIDRKLQAALINCLEDSDHIVRVRAAEQLAHFPGETSINALRKLLTDDSPEVQAAVEQSLEILGGSLVIDEKSTIQWADLLEAGTRAKQ